MPRAEVGSSKHLANQLKAKGLQRLRWFCQVCEKQCRDANGFKQHTLSESHQRNMQIVGEDPKGTIEKYSKEFQGEFISLLRTAHGEKYIGANRFYNEFIRDKLHTHMTSTKWSSLTEFVKYLGREGVVNVKEDEKDGLMIAWRDVSAQAVRRREDIRAQEAAEARNSAGEDKMLKRMAQRAKEEAEAKAKASEGRKAIQKVIEPSPVGPKNGESSGPMERTEEEIRIDGDALKADAPPVKISFGLKAKTVAQSKPGLGQMKSQSIFKRVRAENGEDKPEKKVKL